MDSKKEVMRVIGRRFSPTAFGKLVDIEDDWAIFQFEGKLKRRRFTVKEGYVHIGSSKLKIRGV